MPTSRVTPAPKRTLDVAISNAISLSIPTYSTYQAHPTDPTYLLPALSSAYTCVTNRCVVSAELGTFASKSAVVFAASTSSCVLPC